MSTADCHPCHRQSEIFANFRAGITSSLARVAKKKHKEDVVAATAMVEEIVARIRLGKPFKKKTV